MSNESGKIGRIDCICMANCAMRMRIYEQDSVANRVVFVIETSEGDTKSGKSKGQKSPSVVQGQSPCS